MKLIDLLKIELPKRGGWPEGAHGAVQDKSGQIWFYENGKPYFTGVVWGADPDSHDFDWINWGLRLARSDDYGTEIVTREQYEAAISVQQLIPTGRCTASVEQCIAAGWTVEQLVEQGYFRVVKPVEELPDQAVTVRIKIVENTKKHYTTTKCSEGEMIALTGLKHTAHSFLEKGVQHMKDRAAQRDSEDGERSMKACVDAFNAMFGHSLTETQGWQFMVLLKMARSRNKFNPDDYEDGAAYTGLAGEAHSNEKK